MSKKRYAIYFSPEPESDLWLFGSRWLGRDSATGDEIKRLAVNAIKPKRQREITATAAKYGFHATIKPPFRLSKGHDREMLDEALEAFAAAHGPVKLSALELTELDGFIALRPTQTSAALDQLAADCVRELDHFRKPPSKAELAKRGAADLSDAQRKMLKKWGYPYVMDEYRFHMTLTERLEKPERKAVLGDLRELGKDIVGKPVHIDVLTLMQQKSVDDPFEVVKCYPLISMAKAQWPRQKTR